MEELVHGFYMILLMPDGMYVKEYFEFTRAMTLFECMGFTEDHREAISTYHDDIPFHLDMILTNHEKYLIVFYPLQ